MKKYLKPRVFISEIEEKEPLADLSAIDAPLDDEHYPIWRK